MQDGGRSPSWKCINRWISAISYVLFAPPSWISIFGNLGRTFVTLTRVTQYLTFGKVQDGDGRHLEYGFLVISQSPIKIFRQIWYSDRYWPFKGYCGRKIQDVEWAVPSVWGALPPPPNIFLSNRAWWRTVFLEIEFTSSRRL